LITRPTASRHLVALEPSQAELITEPPFQHGELPRKIHG
jgi:hypothetical protein